LSILTKVFVVILVMASVMFTSVAVSITGRTQHWRSAALGYEAQLKAADATVRNLTAANSAQVATLRDTIAELERQGADLRQQLARTQEESGRYNLELKQVVADRAATEAMNAALVSQLKVAQADGEAYRKQRDALEARNMELEKRNLDLNERINEETARIAVLMEQRRQYEQQINILKQENDVLSRSAGALPVGSRLEDPRGAGLAGVTALTPVAATAVRGQVLDVDGDIITLSVGAADGVKNDMVFVIYRDTQYIGDVRISAVEPNQSAGRLTRSNASPRRNDQVVDEATLRAAQG